MVNYCCVYGCGRNSRLNRHLTFYSLPKEKHRQMQWLKAAGREDLLSKDPEKLRGRFCSRHFQPAAIRKRNLSCDAAPTLHLPGSEDMEWDTESQSHEGIACNNCQVAVTGFRYKCASCPDYDLCQKCEAQEVHPEHLMLRIPRPMKLGQRMDEKEALQLAVAREVPCEESDCDGKRSKVQTEDFMKKLRSLFQAEQSPVSPVQDTYDGPRGVTDEGTVDNASESSDDEPITKYASNYDSGVDLSEDVKEKIRKEVSRALKMKCKKPQSTPKTVTKKKRPLAEMRASKKLKNEGDVDTNTAGDFEPPPEVVFADVNEMNDNQVADVKAELAESETVEVLPAPVMHLKLSEDLSELMIEGTSDEMNVYAYDDPR